MNVSETKKIDMLLRKLKKLWIQSNCKMTLDDLLKELSNDELDEVADEKKSN